MFVFNDLKEEVMQHWEENGVQYLDQEFQSGPNIPDGGFYENWVKPEYQEILDDVVLCIEELGYNNFAEYIGAKKVEKEPMQGVEMGYSRISKYNTKFFFQSAGRDLEFYIERDPKTGMAKLWLNPGNTDGLQAFLGALNLELIKSGGK